LQENFLILLELIGRNTNVFKESHNLGYDILGIPHRIVDNRGEKKGA